jgi:hypothetical protein
MATSRLRVTITAAVASAVAAFSLVACSSGPDTGTVIGKKTEAPYTYYTNECVSYKSNGQCSFSVPIAHDVPRAYYLKLEDGDETGWHEVTSDEYGKYKSGDTYP